MPLIVPPCVGAASRPSDKGASDVCTVLVEPTFTVTEGPAIENVEFVEAGVVRSVARRALSTSATVNLPSDDGPFRSVSRSPIFAVPAVLSTPSPISVLRSKPRVVPLRSLNSRSLPEIRAFSVRPKPPLRLESSVALVSVARPAEERIATPAVIVNAAVRSIVAEPRPETSSGRLAGAIWPESKPTVSVKMYDSGIFHSTASVDEFQPSSKVAVATPSSAASPSITSLMVLKDQLPLVSLRLARVSSSLPRSPSPKSAATDVSTSGTLKFLPSSGTQRPRSAKKAPTSGAVISASLLKSKAVTPFASFRLGSVSVREVGSKRLLDLIRISWAEPTFCWRPPRL